MAKHGNGQTSDREDQRVPRHGQEGFRTKVPAQKILDRVKQENQGKKS